MLLFIDRESKRAPEDFIPAPVVVVIVPLFTTCPPSSAQSPAPVPVTLIVPVVSFVPRAESVTNIPVPVVELSIPKLTAALSVFLACIPIPPLMVIVLFKLLTKEPVFSANINIP